MAEPKKLYKDEKNKMIAGVAAGLAKYADMDVTLMRLIFLAVTLFTGIVPGIIIYIVAAIIMPTESKDGKEIK